MKRRLLVALSIAGVSVFIAVQSMPLQGQSQNQSAIGANTPDLVITAYNGGPPIAYTAPAIDSPSAAIDSWNHHVRQNTGTI